MTVQDDDAARAVLYNADCPVCRIEVNHHRRRAAALGLPVAFDDLNGPARAGWGVDEDTAARRLHVRTANGVVTGWEANLAMWRAMPRWRWLGRAGGLPVVRPVMETLYERAFAPFVYALHKRRNAR